MERLTRTECVRRIRDHLVGKLQGQEDTLCDVAAREGIFCRGFDRFPTHILRERFLWLTYGDQDIPRELLLDRIRRWIHAREYVLELPTACDLMAKEGDLCHGWDTFPNEKLAATFYEVFQRPVEVIDDPAA